MNRIQANTDFARNFVHAVTVRPFFRDLKRMQDAPHLFPRAAQPPVTAATEHAQPRAA